jgi:hypothetical protein
VVELQDAGIIFTAIDARVAHEIASYDGAVPSAVIREVSFCPPKNSRHISVIILATVESAAGVAVTSRMRMTAAGRKRF